MSAPTDADVADQAKAQIANAISERDARRERNAVLREAVDAVDEARAAAVDAWSKKVAADADFEAKNAEFNKVRFELNELLAPITKGVA